MSETHRIQLLRAVSQIVTHAAKPDEEQLQRLSSGFAGQVASFAADELTKSNPKDPEWHTAAANILVALSHLFPNVVLDQLLKEFPAGDLPHPSLVRCFSQFASQVQRERERGREGERKRGERGSGERGRRGEGMDRQTN